MPRKPTARKRAAKLPAGPTFLRIGRPRKELDWPTFAKLCAMQCTLREIAGFFECSEDTVERRVQERHGKTFAEVSADLGQEGKISLRRQQWQLALAGDKTMCIWLGKQYLGQSDKLEERVTDTTLEQMLTEAANAPRDAS